MIRKKNQRSSQHGAVLILTAFVGVVILGICALVLDLGRLMLTMRQLQSAADSAALGAVEGLLKTDPNNPYSTPCSGYLDVNGRVNALISMTPIHARQSLSNVEVLTTVMLVCFDETDGYALRRFQINDPSQYCIANAVDVVIGFSEMPFFFTKIFQALGSGPKSIHATAHIRPANALCTVPTCTAYLDSTSSFIDTSKFTCAACP